jgi:hypothetical protein
MQPLDRIHSRDSLEPAPEGEPRSAEIVSLDEWRRRQGRPVSRRRRPLIVRMPAARPRRSKVPIEAWLLALIFVSALAGAVFALMGLGYLP